MATDKNTSALIQSQVPEYLREEGPKLVAFLKAYYEWMETSGQMTEQSKNLLTNQDIDTTSLEGFYEFFRREVLVDFPSVFKADKRTVAKRIKDLYRSKGSKLSYKLLFRILYDEDVDIIHPSEFILKTSDGRWTKDSFIRVGEPRVGNLDNLLGEFITGQSSGARGKVKELFTTLETGVEVKQLVITDVTGTFIDQEVVLGDNNVSGTIINTIGPLSDVTFDNTLTDRGGAGHRVGDVVNLTSSVGSGGIGKVLSTSDTAVTFDLITGGSGYRKAQTVVSITGGSGSGGSVTVTSISNTETISTFSDPIRALANTKIGFGPTYGVSANTDKVRASANLEASNANTALSSALRVLNTVVGSINSISVTPGSYIVNLPEVKAIDNEIAILELGDGSGGKKGKNARINPRFIPGGITDIEVTTPGLSYSAVFPVTLTNQTRSGTTNAIGTPKISGVLTDPGRFTDSKGFLSWDMKLQDNYYYQEYSYVLDSDKGLQVYRDIVRDVLHPAGTKLFGQVDIQNDINFTNIFDIDSTVGLDLISDPEPLGDELTITSTLAFGTAEVSRAFDIPSIGSITTLGSFAVGQVIEQFVISTTTALGVHDVTFDINPLTFTSDLNLSLINIPGVNDIEIILAGIDVPTFGNITTVTSSGFRVYLDGEGTVNVSNNNIVSTYLSDAITTVLNNPVATFGTPFQVLGVNTLFDRRVKGGSTIEIQALSPTTTGNTTYIVNTVFSNTVLTINTAFGGGGGVALANGVYRYTYDGNI